MGVCRAQSEVEMVVYGCVAVHGAVGVAVQVSVSMTVFVRVPG